MINLLVEMYLKFNYKSARNSVFGILLCTTSFFSTQAQTLDEAREMIKKKDYPAAVTAFSSLIKKYGSRADVNKWYGEALYETGNYEEAEKYLSIAAKRRVAGAYPLLGDLYLRNYKFGDAISNFEKYKATVKKDPIETERTDALIQQAEFCEKALGRVEQVVFVDSIIVDKARFFEYYKLGQESGRLLNYKLLENAVPEEGNVIFESQRADRRVYGKKTGTNGYDLFESSKLYGNKWSEPLAFPENINTAANEDFPFVMTDGTTVYFASDQEPSMGGYDLFVTKYNVSNGSYYTPERLPMPFNSPYNDYLLAIDEGNQIGWFASDRFQQEDKVIIYLFIPNFGEKNYYRDLPQEELINFARIASVRATWPENANYEKLLSSVYNTEEDFTKAKGDFIFVINDKILYYNLNDFENPEARKLYEQAISLRKLYQTDSKDLEQLRRTWAYGNTAARNKIKARILQLEKKCADFQLQIEKLETDSRNAEINYLRRNR
ncbi:MAG: tetratricopeptide repeat protein [Bacteroidales bacterium]